LGQGVTAVRGDGCRRVKYGNFILILYQCRKIARKGVRRVGFSCENAFGNAAGTGFYYGQLAVGVPVALQDAVSSASEERGDRDAVREKGTVEVVVT